MPKYTPEELKKYPGLKELPSSRVNNLLSFWTYVNHLADAMAYNCEPNDDGKPVLGDTLALANHVIVCTCAAVTYKDHIANDFDRKLDERDLERSIRTLEANKQEISKLKRKISDMKRHRKSKKKKGS